MKFRSFDPSENHTSDLPESNGGYLVLLRYALQIKEFIGTEHIPNFSSFNMNGYVYYVLYVGTSTNLKKRIWNQCLNGTADKMTLRKSIGVLLGLKLDQASGNKRFSNENEDKLSGWMQENLIFLYCETQDAMAEAQLLAQYNPPLNIKNNNNPVNAEFRKELSSLRKNDDYNISSEDNIEFNVSYDVPKENIVPGNDEKHTTFITSEDSSGTAKYSKTRIAIGIVVILVILYNICRLFGDYTINEDGKTQYIVTQNFLAAIDYETAQNLNSVYLDNPNEPEITNSYATTNWDKFVNFYQGDIVVILKFDGYGYKVKRLSDGRKGIIPKKMLKKR